MADDKQVYIKIVPTQGEELRICQMFSEESRRDDPENHAVPIFDVFPDNVDPRASNIVMPLLRRVTNPPFQFVADIVDFVDQLIVVCGASGAGPADTC